MNLQIFFSLSECKICLETQMFYSIALKFGRLYKGSSWYQIWLQYRKQSQVYHKNSTNMLGKTINGKKLKIIKEIGNYQASNLLLFERNQPP